MTQKFIVGDLVRYTSLYKEPIAEICETRETSYLIRYMNGNFAKVTSQEIKPIPITTDILEKNGWYGATHSKQSDDNTKILYKTFKRKGYPTIKASQDLKITYELSPFIVKLESVSDLQHLLFGLGINHEMEV